MVKSRWQQLKPGIWGRDIDECERFYHLSARRDDGCYPITGCASFSTTSSSSVLTVGEDDGERHRVEGALRNAWATLCYEHPTLRSRIEHDEHSGRCRRLYSTFRSQDEKESWLDTTFIVVDTKLHPSQWFNEESLSFGISTLFLVRSRHPDKYHQSIFLRCPHDITDGIGILQLVDQLVSYAARAYEQGVTYTAPTWGDEYSRLSPCLRVAATIPDSLSEAQTERFKEIQTENLGTYTHPNLLGLPPSSTTTSILQSRRQRLAVVVPKVTSQQITRNSKAIAPGVSVTHVFMSALAIALSELQPPKEESHTVRYVNHSMINLRPYCSDSYSTPEHAGAAYHTVSAQALGIDLVVPPLATCGVIEGNVDQLPRITTDVRDFFKRIRPISSTDEQVTLAPLMFKSLTPSPGSDPHMTSSPPFCPVPLSSIGNVASVVSPRYGSFKIMDVWASSEPIGAGVAVFLGTWDGEIQLSGVFDTRYHDANYIHKFLERIVNCVTRGLDINDYVAPK
ncbi:uncharacterized protein F4822DRAFT_417837 [Hypoxylon trugodes]|uniref:uncharacterized protein n=1 Tax=Hypoxylon trugodes TaxID=326681 RepID=UPI0021A0EDF9|nr:uncharacterized protein F4822DRAFT_417837 [Hypoxylon trugodes]KAI1383852.1 hypothetical protein F4822DRAFT_417837 [Hypoxylon trugodes]